MAIRVNPVAQAARAPVAWPRWLVALACVLALWLSPAKAQSTDIEYRVKAAYIYNFTRFIEWPAASYPAANMPLDICVLGADEFSQLLDQAVSGKNSGGHPLATRRVRQASDIESCKILFISAAEQSRAGDLLYAVRGRPVLTVGESPDFITSGGIINFVIVDGKVRFTINKRTAEQARLTISSKLLSVAHAVVSEPAN